MCLSDFPIFFSESFNIGSWADNSVYSSVPVEDKTSDLSSEHLVHSLSYQLQDTVPSSESVPWSSQTHARHSSDSWSSPIRAETEDEFSWSVGQYDNSVENKMVVDNRLSQDYDDIDYTSGSLVSFHTSLTR